MKTDKRRVSELMHDPANVRKHDERNIAAIKSSLARFGQQKPIVVDANGIVRAGNGTLFAAKELGWEWIECVQSELSGSEATAYAIADNRSAELAEWDIKSLESTLQALAAEDVSFRDAVGFDAAAMQELAVNALQLDQETKYDSRYTAKLGQIVYEPTGPKPKLHEVFDDTKALALIAAIDQSSLSEDEKHFLRAAAYRHVIINFENAAELYAHSSSDMQSLMEQSALVLIDFDTAAENGYVQFTDEMLRIISSAPTADDFEDSNES
jgi:ParB-like chromosome segregation protein Spo0J